MFLHIISIVFVSCVGITAGHSDCFDMAKIAEEWTRIGEDCATKTTPGDKCNVRYGHCFSEQLGYFGANTSTIVVPDKYLAWISKYAHDKIKPTLATEVKDCGKSQGHEYVQCITHILLVKCEELDSGIISDLQSYTNGYKQACKTEG